MHPAQCDIRYALPTVAVLTFVSRCVSPNSCEFQSNSASEVTSGIEKYPRTMTPGRVVRPSTSAPPG
eukprot:4190760-Amphidinium_carterae.1